MKIFTQLKITLLLIAILSGGVVNAQEGLTKEETIQRFKDIRAMKHKTPLETNKSEVYFTVSNASNDETIENSLPWVFAQIPSQTEDVVISFNIPETDTINNIRGLNVSNFDHDIIIYGDNISTENSIVLNAGSLQGSIMKFSSMPDNTVAINYITFLNGGSWFGGKGSAVQYTDIYWTPIENCNFINCNSGWGSYGGAVYAKNTDYFWLRTSTFDNNNATYGKNVYLSNVGGADIIGVSDVTQVKSDGGQFDFAFTNTFATIDSSSVGSVGIGVMDTSDVVNTNKSHKGYAGGVSFAASKIDSVHTSDQQQTGMKYMLYLTKPMSHNSGKTFANDTIYNLIVDSANVSLVMDSVNVSSNKWSVKQGSLSVVNMPDMPRSSYEANIVMDSLVLQGGQFSNDSTPNNITNITAKGVKMSQLETSKGIVPSQFKLGTGSNIIKEITDGLPFIEVGNGSAVTLSGDASIAVPENETLFNLADGASLIIEGDSVDVTGASQMEITYDNATAFVSSPVANVPLQTLDADFQLWNESSLDWSNVTSGNLEAMVGYKAAFNDNPSITLVGDLLPANQSITLENTNIADVNLGGWNLVGNPFSSALDFENIALSGIDKALYTYDATSGNYKVYMQGGLSVNNGSQLISKGEAFFLKASENNAIFDLGTVDKRHNINSLLSLAEHDQREIDGGNILLTLSNSENSDQTIIAVNDNASQNYETGEDAVKLFADAIPQLYTNDEDNVNLAINVFDLNLNDNDMVVPLNIKNATSGSYDLTLENNFAEDEFFAVYLTDLVTNQTVNFINNPVYTFTADGTEQRFEITFSYATDINEISKNNPISVYPNPTSGKLQINNNGLKINRVIITTITGKTIFSFSKSEIEKSSNHQIDISSLTDGIYFINITTEKGIFTKKIIKQ